MNDLVARAAVSIRASRDRVWQALVTPSAIKEYMFGTDVRTTWRKGDAITWSGEFKGKKYEDKGVILEADPGRTLRYSHFSPMSGMPDVPENYHTVTITLSGSDGDTEVSLSQDRNADEAARKESEKNWTVMLEGLKRLVERSS